MPIFSVCCRHEIYIHVHTTGKFWPIVRIMHAQKRVSKTCFILVLCWIVLTTLDHFDDLCYVWQVIEASLF